MINSERALILAPGGRDGAVAATLLRDAGRESQICASLAELLICLNEGAGLAIITAEALQYADLTLIRGWIEQQPAWSDFPFLILNHRGDKPEQAGLVHQLHDTLGNVIVLERPFHPSALLNVVDYALRGRRRQYQARRYLEDIREGEQRLQTALLAGRMGPWELDIPDHVLTGSEQFRAIYGRGPQEAFVFADLIEAVVPADQPQLQRAMDDAINTGADLVLEHRVRWPDGSLHWVDFFF